MITLKVLTIVASITKSHFLKEQVLLFHQVSCGTVSASGLVLSLHHLGCGHMDRVH